MGCLRATFVLRSLSLLCCVLILRSCDSSPPPPPTDRLLRDCRTAPLRSARRMLKTGELFFATADREDRNGAKEWENTPRKENQANFVQVASTTRGAEDKKEISGCLHAGSDRSTLKNKQTTEAWPMVSGPGSCGIDTICWENEKCLCVW